MESACSEGLDSSQARNDTGYVIQSKRSAAKNLIASRRGELFLQSNQIYSPKLVFVESGGLEGLDSSQARNDINVASSRMTRAMSLRVKRGV